MLVSFLIILRCYPCCILDTSEREAKDVAQKKSEEYAELSREQLQEEEHGEDQPADLFDNDDGCSQDRFSSRSRESSDDDEPQPARKRRKKDNSDDQSHRGQFGNKPVS